MKKIVTDEYLKSRLSYNKKTGVFRWRINPRRTKKGSIAGCINGIGYHQIKIDYRTYLSHRLAWLFIYGEWPTMIDHKNRIRSDNRISNLRITTPSQNCVNTDGKGNLSGFKGVYKKIDTFRSKPWMARIIKDGNQIIFGHFSTKKEAELAHRKGARKLFGEFQK